MQHANMRLNMNEKIKEMHDHVLERILDGSFADGAVPRETELARLLGSNRMNAHFAMKELENKGVVYRVKGRGTFVVDGLDLGSLKKMLYSAGKYVHVFCALERKSGIHWDETTLQALEKVLSNDGYGVIYKDIPEDLTADDISRLLAESDAEGGRAVLVFPNRNNFETFLENKSLLIGHNAPVFFVNRGMESDKIPFPSVSIDFFNEGLVVGERLRECSCCDVRFLTVGKGAPWSRLRYDGLTTGFASELPVAHFEKLDSDYFRSLNSLKEKPVFVSHNDRLGASFIDMAKSEGILCPEHFQLIGFDNNPAFRSRNMSTMAPPLELIGELLGKFVTDDFNATKKGISNFSLKVKSTLIERQTFRADQEQRQPWQKIGEKND